MGDDCALIFPVGAIHMSWRDKCVGSKPVASPFHCWRGRVAALPQCCFICDWLCQSCWLSRSCNVSFCLCSSSFSLCNLSRSARKASYMWGTKKCLFLLIAWLLSKQKVLADDINYKYAMKYYSIAWVTSLTLKERCFKTTRALTSIAINNCQLTDIHRIWYHAIWAHPLI
jgi:hypothetical protein